MAARRERVANGGNRKTTPSAHSSSHYPFCNAIRRVACSSAHASRFKFTGFSCDACETSGSHRLLSDKGERKDTRTGKLILVRRGVSCTSVMKGCATSIGRAQVPRFPDLPMSDCGVARATAPAGQASDQRLPSSAHPSSVAPSIQLGTGSGVDLSICSRWESGSTTMPLGTLMDSLK